MSVCKVRDFLLALKLSVMCIPLSLMVLGQKHHSASRASRSERSVRSTPTLSRASFIKSLLKWLVGSATCRHLANVRLNKPYHEHPCKFALHQEPLLMMDGLLKAAFAAGDRLSSDANSPLVKRARRNRIVDQRIRAELSFLSTNHLARFNFVHALVQSSTSSTGPGACRWIRFGSRLRIDKRQPDLFRAGISEDHHRVSFT